MNTDFLTKLAQHIPNLDSFLNESAGEELIARLESETGFVFPESLKEFYRRHNGEKGKLHLLRFPLFSD